jgi:hypothetical protein
MSRRRGTLTLLRRQLLATRDSHFAKSNVLLGWRRGSGDGMRGLGHYLPVFWVLAALNWERRGEADLLRRREGGKYKCSSSPPCWAAHLRFLNPTYPSLHTQTTPHLFEKNLRLLLKGTYSHLHFLFQSIIFWIRYSPIIHKTNTFTSAH